MAAKALSYGDVLLRQQDIDLLRGPYWLNDQLIAFFFSFLESERHPGLSAAFCGGSLAFLISQVGPEDAAAILAPLQTTEKQLVLLAVNDNLDCEVVNGGSHWSLLVFCQEDSTFRHFDSAGGSNSRVARRLAQTLHPALLGQSKGSKVRFEEPAFPSQANGHDCGLYVLAAADAICGQWATGSCDWAGICGNLRSQLSPKAVAGWRQQLLGLIDERVAAAGANST